MRRRTRMRTFALRALLAALAAAALAGCGGGSPSDLVLPQDVEVTVRPSGVPGPHSVGLEYVAKSGREITLQLSGLSLEAATGVAFEIRFDNALLEFVGSSPGTFFGADAVTGAAVSENDAAVVVGVAAAADQSVGRSGSGPLITLRFRLRELRDAEDDLVFGTPQSQVYGPAGIAGQHTFTGAILTTRIQAPQ